MTINHVNYKPRYEISFYGLILFSLLFGTLLFWILFHRYNTQNLDINDIWILSGSGIFFLGMGFLLFARIIKNIHINDSMIIDYMIGEKIIGFDQIQRYTKQKIKTTKGEINLNKIKNVNELLDVLYHIEKTGTLKKEPVTLEEVNRALLEAQSVIVGLILAIPIHYLTVLYFPEFIQTLPEFFRASIFLIVFCLLYPFLKFFLLKNKTINGFIFDGIPSAYSKTIKIFDLFKISNNNTENNNVAKKSGYYVWVILRIVGCSIVGIAFILNGIINGFDTNPELQTIRIVLSVLSVMFGIFCLKIAFWGWK